MLDLGRNLPLIFHEAGMDTEFKGAYNRPLRMRTADMIGKRDAGIVIEPLPGSEMGHVALFAAFLSKRTRMPVSFDFNKFTISVDASLAEINEIANSEDELAEIQKRFESIEGLGAITLDEAVQIVDIANKAVADYDSNFHK